MAGKRDAGDKTQRGVMIVTAVLVVAILAVGWLMTLTTKDPAGKYDYGVGVATVLLFVAAAAVGTMAGFLFGMPRTQVADALTAGDTAPAPRASTKYLTNSNLIKVSDWLTTIIIGLGLVNLGKIVPGLRSLATALHAPLGGGRYAGTIGLSILIAGVVAGFLLVYLWTSIRFRELLEEAERGLEVVPDFQNETLANARRTAGGTSFRLVAPDGAADNATVTKQQPPAGATVTSGKDVTVEVTP